MKFISLLLIFFSFFPLLGNIEKILEEANRDYTLGQQETNFNLRKQAFNRSLKLYNILKNELGADIPILNERLGDNFFQLKEYPWAILYYQRALKKDKGNPSLLYRLEKAQEKLDLQEHSQSYPSKITLLLSGIQKLHLFYWLILFLILLYSIIIWKYNHWIFTLANSMTFFLFLFLIIKFYSYYFTPVEGILVNSTGFYRAPGWAEPQISSFPLLSGSKVFILQITSEGNWLKIQKGEQIGYIPTNSLRLI